MSAFQSNVQFRFTQGLVGESMFDAPRVSKTWRLDPAGVKQAKVGLACTYKQDLDNGPNTGAGDIMIAQIGAPNSTTAYQFAGIIAVPKHYTLTGNAGVPLAPSLNLNPGDLVELVTETNIVGFFSTATTYGEPVYFKAADGTLAVLAGTTPTGSTPGPGFLQIPGAFILSTGTTANDYALIQLNGAVAIAAGT